MSTAKYPTAGPARLSRGRDSDNSASPQRFHKDGSPVLRARQTGPFRAGAVVSDGALVISGFESWPRSADGSPSEMNRAHESGQLTRLAENLNYSAKRLMQVWPNRFPALEKAQQYERNPEKLANYVYAKRLGNGDETSGDGWRYRGRGLIQLTGRGNYRAAAQGIGQPLEGQPELLEQPGPAALSAAWFWKSHGLNELADDRNDDNDTEDFRTVTKRINGGTVGLKERMAFWEKAKAVLQG